MKVKAEESKIIFIAETDFERSQLMRLARRNIRNKSFEGYQNEDELTIEIEPKDDWGT